MGHGTASGAMNLRSTQRPSSHLSPLRPRVEATEFCEGAPRTDRPDRPAKVLPEPDEELIDEQPVGKWHTAESRQGKRDLPALSLHAGPNGSALSCFLS